MKGENMKPKTEWKRYRLTCPESGEAVEVLTEWKSAEGALRLTGMSCNSPVLRDLSGRPCAWACWNRIYKEK